jgi:hypothetical protein
LAGYDQRVVDLVIFRPGRIAGLGDFPVNPPIAELPAE